MWAKIRERRELLKKYAPKGAKKLLGSPFLKRKRQIKPFVGGKDWETCVVKLALRKLIRNFSKRD